MAGEFISAAVRRPLLRRVLRPVAALVAVTAVGVVGFVAIAGIGVVEALFWLLDPTSVEIYVASHDVPATRLRAFTIAVELGLLLAGLWIGETVLSSAFGGQIGSELRRMRTQRTIESTENHVVVCGYGTFGKTVARSLRDRDRDVVVVETQDAQYERALDEDFLAVQGDARREERLLGAGVERAEAVVGAIDDSNANIQIAITADEIAPEAAIVVRVGEDMYEPVARRAGADRVVVPEVISARQLTTDLAPGGERETVREP